MNEFQMIQTFENVPVRTVMDEDIVWFALKDVCAILGIVDQKQVWNRLEDDERGRYKIPTPRGGKQLMQVVNEPGLYNVILRSNSAKAKPFRRWVTHDVLPAIRRKGYYSIIPEEQLAEILIANMNNADRLKHVIIPAMRDADVEQIRLMAAYMGLDAKDISTKLFSVSDENLTAKRMIDNWHKYKLGDYTLADFPEPYNKHPSAMVALDATRRKRDAYGRFAKYCGVVHFNRDGYLSVIEQMKKRRYISAERAEEWIDSLSF